MRRPPPLVILLAVVILALGQTAGVLLAPLRPSVERYARARIAANAGAHGLTGAVEYDTEIRDRTVFAAEAGLSFFHTHAAGLPPVILLAATLVASLVSSSAARGTLYLLLAAGALFPLGYLAYALAVLEVGRDAGVALAERFILTPLGSAAILSLVGLTWALGRSARTGRPAA